MKNTAIAFLIALTASSALASTHERVLQEVDALVAQDSYEFSFSCGNKAIKEEEVCFGDQCNIVHLETVVTTCGEMTVLTTTSDSRDDGSHVSELVINKALYEKFKGNPLRVMEATSEKYKDSLLDWKSAIPVEIDYMGEMRKALQVIGEVEVCTEEKSCTKGSIAVLIVQGVPFLAKFPALGIDLDGLTISQNLVEFSEKE